MSRFKSLALIHLFTYSLTHLLTYSLIHLLTLPCATMNPFDEFRQNLTRRHFLAAGLAPAGHGRAGVAGR